MKRLIISLLLLMAIASMTALEARSTIEFGNEWHLSVANVGSNGIFLGVDKTTVGEYTYFVDMRNDQYLYRQDDRKVYRYSVATQEEDLVLDFGLQVNDVFTHHDGSQWVVESLSDTTVLYYGMYGSQLCMHLRNSESSQADTWIEGIGSLHYGINPPEDMAVIDQYHLLSFAQWEWGSYIFEFIEDNIACKNVTTIGEYYEEYQEYEEYINLSLKNNKLYIEGGEHNDGVGRWYMLAEEREGAIYLGLWETAPDADQWIFCTYSVEFDNFTQSQYEVFFEGKSVGTVSRQNSETLFTNSTSWSELARTMDSAHIYDYYIANDTIVGGKIYKVVRCKQTGGKTLLHISPDNNKVYRHDANSDKLIYDFGDWYVGKSILSDNYMSDDMLPDAVADCSIDHIGVMQDYDGRELEYMTLSLTLRNGEVIPTNDPILRGIGSTTGILYGDFDYVVMPNGSSNELISFSIYGSTVYNRGYKAYPFNYVEKCDELQPATAVWKGDSITITGTICAEWGEESGAVALVEEDEIRVVLTNTSLVHDNANYNHKYALTIDASDVTAEEVTIFIEPVAEYVTVSKSGVAKNKVSPFSLHRSGDALVAVFPTAGAGEAITLYDATGRVVAVQPISEGATTASINVANLPNGIYIARLNSGASAKVVK